MGSFCLLGQALEPYLNALGLLLLGGAEDLLDFESVCMSAQRVRAGIVWKRMQNPCTAKFLPLIHKHFLHVGVNHRLV